MPMRSGDRLLLDTEDGLVEMVDRNGNRVRYTRDGIFPDRGIGVTFTRDAEDRITAMSLGDDTSLSYVYDASGDLVSTTDRAGVVTEYLYDSEHRLLSFNDVGHSAIAVQQYDPDGRLLSSVAVHAQRGNCDRVQCGAGTTSTGPR